MRMRRIRWLLRVANFGKRKKERLAIRQKKPGNSIRQFTTCLRSKLCSSYSLAVSTIAVSNQLICRSVQFGVLHAAVRFHGAVAPAESPKISFSLRGEEADHSVDSSPCALHSTVRDVLRRNCRVLR